MINLCLEWLYSFVSVSPFSYSDDLSIRSPYSSVILSVSEKDLVFFGRQKFQGRWGAEVANSTVGDVSLRDGWLEDRKRLPSTVIKPRPQDADVTCIRDCQFVPT